MIPKTGMGTKDFIAPTSFDFRQTRLFRMGSTWGAASYMQIMASELSDKLLPRWCASLERMGLW
jgi:hypothetical protein